MKEIGKNCWIKDIDSEYEYIWVKINPGEKWVDLSKSILTKNRTIRTLKEARETFKGTQLYKDMLGQYWLIEN